MKTCQHCGSLLRGRQEKWCSPACRVTAYHAHRAGYYLSALPQEEWREAIRESCERRWPGRRGRASFRFGEPGWPRGGPGPRH